MTAVVQHAHTGSESAGMFHQITAATVQVFIWFDVDMCH